MSSDPSLVPEYDVVLYLYDLSQGMAKVFSPGFLGKQVRLARFPPGTLMETEDRFDGPRILTQLYLMSNSVHYPSLLPTSLPTPD